MSEYTNPLAQVISETAGGSINEAAFRQAIDEMICEDSQVLSIDWREEVRQMFEEEQRRPQKYKWLNKSGFKMLQDVILNYLTAHPDGLLRPELKKMFTGVAVAVGHDADSIDNAIKNLVDADKAIVLSEKVNWPHNTGWEVEVDRIRASFDAWVRAVS